MQPTQYYFVQRDHSGLIIFGLYWDWYDEKCIKPFMQSHVETIQRWVELTQKYPHYRYVLQLDGLTFEDMVVQAPGLADTIREALDRGKVEIVEGSYCQPYHHLFGGESTIRQLQLGRKAVKDVFGYEIVTMSNQEHAWHTQMPQILRDLGYRHVILQTPWTKRGWCPSYDACKIWWVGLDGTRVETVPTWSGIPTGWTQLLDPFDESQMMQAQRCAKERGIEHVLLTYSNDVCWVPRHISEQDIATSTISGTPVTFVTDREFVELTPPPSKDVQFDMDAFRSRQTYGAFGEIVYRRTKEAENKLLTAEKLLACCEMMGKQDDLKPRSARLTQAWKWLCVGENHDMYCVPGNWDSVHETTVADYGLKLIEQSIAESNTQIDDLLRRLSSHAETRPTFRIAAGETAYPLLVFNPLCWSRIDAVEFQAEFPNGRAFSLAIHDGTARVPFQIVRQTLHQDGSYRSVTIAMEAEVPGVGYRVYYLIASETKATAPTFDSGLHADRHMMENSFYRLTFDPNRGGGLTEVFDKRQRRNLLDTTHHLGNTFVGSVHSSEDSLARLEFAERGPVRTVATISGKYQDIPFRCRVALYQSIQRVDFDTHFDFGEEPVEMSEAEKLKVVFPPAKADHCFVDMPFGVYETTRPSSHGINFFSACSPEGTMTLVNTGTPAYVTADHEADSFTNQKKVTGTFCLKGPKGASHKRCLSPFSSGKERNWGLANILAFGPKDALLVEGEWEGKTTPRGPKQQMPPTLFAYVQGCTDDQGRIRGFWFREHRYRYSVVSHKGTWEEGHTVHRAMEINSPLIATTNVSPSSGKWPARHSFCETEDSSALLSSMYPTQNGIIARFWEGYGRHGRLHATFTPAPEKVASVDLNLRKKHALDVCDGTIACEVTPWQIVNLRLSI